MAEISEPFVASISEALQSANIPCVLWGHCLHYTHGIPIIIASIDFVVPDWQLRASVTMLHSLGRLEPCPDIASCVAGHHNRFTPPAAFHMHIKGSGVTVGLYPQSDNLWFLPELDQTLAHPRALEQHPNFVLASDKTTLPPDRPGRGSGAFNPANPPVLIPRSIVLLEAFLRLYARDCAKQVGGFAMAMVAYVELYVDADGYVYSSQLAEPLRTSYQQLKEGEKPIQQWTRELKDALGVEREAGEDTDKD